MHTKSVFSLFLFLLLFAACSLQTSDIEQGNAAQAFQEKLRALPSGSQGINNEYIVVFKDSSGGLYRGLANSANSETTNESLSVLDSYQRALPAILVRAANESSLYFITADPSVKYVQQNFYFEYSEIPEQPQGPNAPNDPDFFDQMQQPAVWNLARIDQRPWDSLAPDTAYVWPEGVSGGAVRAYVIDSGINPHSEFCRDYIAEDCLNRIDLDHAFPDSSQHDYVGHGTHVSGILGGLTYGVAKQITLVPINVDDLGRPTVALILAGIEHVLGLHEQLGGPAVANMSLGGPRTESVDTAVESMIRAGISVAVAAGNDSSTSACDRSPSGVRDALTVGASDINDAVTYFSSQGPCVDVFAPGDQVVSADIHNFTGSVAFSGTSMSAPHVAGAAALLLEGALTIDQQAISPRTVAAHVKCRATSGALSNLAPETADRLLYMRHFGSSINNFVTEDLSSEDSSTPGPTLSFVSPVENQAVVNPITINLGLQSCAFGSIKLEELDVNTNAVKRTLVDSSTEQNQWTFVFETGPVRLRAAFCDYFNRCTDPKILNFTALEAASTIFLPIVSR
ncbi:MAG: S8 family peptidase [Myxococcales bacterium]|nr:MAG: S8 family peptidase [Myxococcales bacterium]